MGNIGWGDNEQLTFLEPYFQTYIAQYRNHRRGDLMEFWTQVAEAYNTRFPVDTHPIEPFFSAVDAKYPKSNITDDDIANADSHGVRNHLIDMRFLDGIVRRDQFKYKLCTVSISFFSTLLSRHNAYCLAENHLQIPESCS